MFVKFITKEGEYLVGLLMTVESNEGYKRYIITYNGKDYICEDKDGKIVECV